MRKYLTDLQTQALQAKLKAQSKLIERQGKNLKAIKTKSPRSVT